MQNLFRHARSGPSRTGDAGHFSLRRWFRLLLVPIVAGMLLASWFSGTASAARLDTADGYNCGDGESHHCYSEIIWSERTNGVRTSIFTNQIWGGDCFVTNETWLEQDDASGLYWVEAGIVSSDEYGEESDALFWSEQRPSYGYTNYYGEFLGNNDFGTFATVEITKKPGNTFDINITGLPQASLHATINNPISPNRIATGMELCGTSGASAPWNGFTNNQYQDPTSGEWSYQTTNNGSIATFGGSKNGYPTYKKVFSAPAGESNHGGDFRTCILGAGCTFSV